jgi:mitochondrial chaperone BCS1
MPLVTMLETFIPGLSLMTKFLSDYFKIDITQYLWGILAVLALTTVVNYCTDKFWGVWNEYLVSTAQVNYNDEIYNYLMYWISKHGMSKRATHFIVGTQTNSSYVYTGDDDDDETNPYEMDEDAFDVADDISAQPRNWDRMKILRYTPSQGTHYFRYKGRYLTFTRTQEKETGYYGASMREQIFLSCLGRNPQILKDLIQEAQRAYMERDGNKTIIYRGSKPIGGASEDMEWVRCTSRPPRPLSTVVLDEFQKNMILDDMKEYLHPRTKRWYSNRGIPYRRGYLMEGPPGTGKTSLCFALAGVLQLRIYVASLNSRSITEDSLASLFRDLPRRCIVLLEDIDSAGLAAKRTEESKSEKSKEKDENTTQEEPADGTPTPPSPADNSAVNKALSLSGFLNIIDGVASNEGHILVLTTNHMERLDPALLRPGRVDMVIRFGLADASMIKGIFKAIYSTFESESPLKAAMASANGSAVKGEKPTNGSLIRRPRGVLHHGKSDEEIAALAEKFAEIMPAKEFTPAEIQNYLLKHKMHPERAIEELQEWVDQTREEKKSLTTT